QGSETALSQIVAEMLGISLEDVTVTAADTLYSPYETGSYASSQAYVAGNAVHAAAEDIIDKVKTELSTIYDVPPQQIEWKQGVFSFETTGDSVRLNFREAIEKMTFSQTGKVMIGRSSFKPHRSPPPFAACWAKIAYDALTRSIEIRHIIETVDVGTALNSDIVTGQIEGGIIMGLGYALMEQLEIDKRTSKPATNDLLTYKIPAALDLAEIHTYIATSFEPTGPLGAKSVGEMTTIPIAGAVVNAVVAATGMDVVSLPLTKHFNIKNKR
ncbi:MAG: molybdopterin-dependent oxidoreductase, partial [Deltaproteobacteria bacterium]|nr:molybdopterin-dependent oxidoreductase [Deltaproteobacteria bacterium]